MNKKLQSTGEALFDQIKHIDSDGNEYWCARELGPLLGYSEWRKFSFVITRAETSLKNTGVVAKNHFDHMDKMVTIGSKTERHIADIRLTRYACYIIAQNGNAAKKPEIAAAQAYFAVKTRRQEVAEQIKHKERLEARDKYDLLDNRLTEALVEKDMRAHYGVINPYESLADHTPNIVLTAKSLANEITAHNLEQYPIDTFDDIKGENEDNNHAVRQTLIKRGITPEDLPPAEDTKKIRQIGP